MCILGADWILTTEEGLMDYKLGWPFRVWYHTAITYVHLPIPYC